MKVGFLERLQRRRASSHIEGRNSWFFSSSESNLGVPLKSLGSQGPACVASGKSSLHASCEQPLGIPLQSVPGARSSSGAEARTSGFLWSFHMGVRPHLVWRLASPLSSRAVKVVSDFLSS